MGLLVCGGLMEIQTSALILMKFYTHTRPHLFKKVFGAGLTPTHRHWAWGAWNPMSWRTNFWKLFTKQKMFSRLQINPCRVWYLSLLGTKNKRHVNVPMNLAITDSTNLLQLPKAVSHRNSNTKSEELWCAILFNSNWRGAQSDNTYPNSIIWKNLTINWFS